MEASTELNVQVTDETVAELSKALEHEEMKGKAIRVAVSGVG